MTSTGKATRDIPDRAINPDGTLLRRFERDGAERIAVALDAWRRRIFAGLTDDTITNAVSRVDTESGPLRDVLLFLVQEWAEAGAEFGREQIEALVFGVKRHESLVDFDWQLVNTSALEWAQRYVGDLIRGINAVTRRRIQAEVAQFVETGESVLALARRLVGIGPFSDDRARMIAVTEVTRAYAEGNMTAWRETGVIERRRWNTANDELVCPICGPRHNTVVGLDEDFDGITAPPAHPRCRCWLTPVIVDRQREVGVNLDRIGRAPIIDSFEDVIRQAEEEIRRRRTERAILYDADGRLLFTKDGNESSVSFTEEEMAQFNGATITHNHPSGRSFSRFDMRMVQSAGLREIRAVGVSFDGRPVGYRFRVLNPAFYGGETSFVDEVLDQAESVLRNEFLPRSWDDESVHRANHEISHAKISYFVERVNRFRPEPWVEYAREYLD